MRSSLFFFRRSVFQTTLCAVLILFAIPALTQEKIVWSTQEQRIVDQIRTLRKLDDMHEVTTGQARRIRQRVPGLSPKKS